MITNILHQPPGDINRVILEEIPNKNTNPDAYEAVIQFMMHAWTMWRSK